MTDNIEQSDNKRIAKNTLYMSIRMVFVLIITLYSSRILLKILGVEDYGIYNVVAGFVTLFSFISTSFSNGIQRFYNYELGKSGIKGANKVYNSALIIQVSIGLILVIPTYFVGEWYIHNKMVIPLERIDAAFSVLKFSLLTFLFQILQVPYSASVMAHERMGFYSVLSVVNSILMLLVALILPFLNSDVLVLYSALLAFLAFALLMINIIYSKQQFPEIYLHRIEDNSLLKEMSMFSGWNMLGTLGSVLKDQGSNLILNSFFGPIVNAARAIAMQVNGGLQSFVANIAIPVRPQVIQSYSKGDINRSLNLTYTISKMSCFFLFFLSLPIMLEIDYVLNLWLGNGYPDYTGVFVILIIINGFLNNLNSSVSGIVHASGKMRVYQTTGAIISILSVLLVYISVSNISFPIVAFIVIIIMDSIRQIVALCVLKKIVPEFSFLVYIKTVLLPLLKVILLGSLLPLAVHFSLGYGVMRFIVVVLLSFISTSFVIYKYGLIKSEKSLFKDYIFRYIKR